MEIPMIVGVRFTPSGRVRYCDDNGVNVAFGDKALVESESGAVEAVVIIGSGQAVHSDISGPLPRVLRLVERAPEIP